MNAICSIRTRIFDPPLRSLVRKTVTLFSTTFSHLTYVKLSIALKCDNDTDGPIRLLLTLNNCIVYLCLTIFNRIISFGNNSQLRDFPKKKERKRERVRACVCECIYKSFNVYLRDCRDNRDYK